MGFFPLGCGFSPSLSRICPSQVFQSLLRRCLSRPSRLTPSSPCSPGLKTGKQRKFQGLSCWPLFPRKHFHENSCLAPSVGTRDGEDGHEALQVSFPGSGAAGKGFPSFSDPRQQSGIVVPCPSWELGSASKGCQGEKLRELGMFQIHAPAPGTNLIPFGRLEKAFLPQNAFPAPKRLSRRILRTWRSSAGQDADPRVGHADIPHSIPIPASGLGFAGNAATRSCCRGLFGIFLSHSVRKRAVD